MTLHFPLYPQTYIVCSRQLSTVKTFFKTTIDDYCNKSRSAGENISKMFIRERIYSNIEKNAITETIIH